MSYFFATLGKCSDELKAINDYFDRTTRNIPKFSVKGESVNIQYYGEKKVLEDVYIQDDKTGSWLLILGMPMCDLSLGKAISLEEYFSDPKTILNSKIDGHFCLLAFNGLLGRLLVATDSNSFIPVYYKELRDGFIISSSELALAYSTDAKIDQIGFAQSISLGVVWGNRTRFNGIKKLRACEILSTSINGGHSVEYYWHPEDEDIWREPNEIIISRWAETAGNGLQRMVKIAGTNSVSADITGGEDSRIVLALCHSLGIPVSSLRVRGFPEDADVCVAKDIAGKLEIPLNVEQYRTVDVKNLSSSACDASIGSEGYGSIFSSLTRETTDRYYGGHRECTSLHLCGVPGGEAYRGSYYLRAKLWSPASMKMINIPFFARMKFLLDYLPDLFELPSGKFLEVVYDHMSETLNEVRKFPSGIKVDHLLRMLQTCVLGLNMRQPFYFPLGLRDLTKTVYSVPPTLKRGGRLTKACTEQLYPDLAWIKTQKGVPTVRRTLSRSYLFSLGYYSQIKSIVGGVSTRILHRNQDNAKLDVGHLSNYHAETMRYILTQEECSEYFRSRDSMITGCLYNDKSLSSLLMNAKTGKCNYVEILGRVINAELSMQYISKKR